LLAVLVALLTEIAAKRRSAAHEGFEGGPGLGAFQPRGEIAGLLVDTGDDLATITTNEIAGDAQRLRRFGRKLCSQAKRQ
jgi:hypothetical protein